MSTLQSVLLCLALMLSGTGQQSPAQTDLAHLREILHDKQDPRNQSQAALLLLQSPSPEAEEIIRAGLKQTGAEDVFTALAAALRLTHDARFGDELFAALIGGKPAVRQAAETTLAEVADATLLRRFRLFVEDAKADWNARQAIMAVLGRNGRREAVVILLDQLSSTEDKLRQAAADALAEATGQTYGLDVNRWQSWWDVHKEMTSEHWLEERLAYQASRARRLQGELDQARAQIVRMHQQLFSRLPAGDRLSMVQSLADATDAALRALAIGMALELLPTADAVGQRCLADLLLHCCADGSAEIQKAAVLALGQSNDGRAFDKLLDLLTRGSTTLRGAAAHALARQIKGSGRDALTRQRRVIPALQKALDDPNLEVVVEAAESLGALGAPEAGPVLTVLLRHPSASVRQTAALALERVADISIVDGLLQALDDSDATVRFSLVGALGHAAGTGHTVGPEQRARLLAHLEGVFLRDGDPGVRSRAATVLGDCGSVAMMPTLWRRVQANEDVRVQEKAWAAIQEILVRSGNPDLIQEWDRLLIESKQGQRRLQLLTEVYTRWQKRDETRKVVPAVQEALIQAQLDEGKWLAALPLVRDALATAASDSEIDRRLQWLLAVGQRAMKEGNRQEALHVVREAQPFTARRPGLAGEFEKLEKLAKP